MIRVAVDLRRSRARRPDKPGAVVFRLTGASERGGSGKVCLNAGIPFRQASDAEVIDELRGEIVERIAWIGEEAARIADAGAPLTIEAVAAAMRRRIAAAEELRRSMPKRHGLPSAFEDAGEEDKEKTTGGRKPVLRGDLVKVAPSFYEDFRYIRAGEPQHGSCAGGLANGGGLLAFVEEDARRCRASRRVSSARGAAALLRMLRRWLGAEEGRERGRELKLAHRTKPDHLSAGPEASGAAAGAEASGAAAGAELAWGEVSAGMVGEFASWLATAGIAESTQSFYLRRLRTLLFSAASRGLCDAEAGWFAPVNTKVVKPRKRRALPQQASGARTMPNGELPAGQPYRVGLQPTGADEELMERMRSADVGDDEWLALARDMWLFGRLCGGMELVDIAHLTPENLKKGELNGGDSSRREVVTLTYRRRRVGREVRLELPPEAVEILGRYAGRGPYLFPLLQPGVLFESRRGRINRLLRRLLTLHCWHGKHRGSE